MGTAGNPFNYHRQPMAHAAWEQGYLAGQASSEADIKALEDNLEDHRRLISELALRFPKVDRWLNGE